jgi:hypothetical protein
MKSFGRMITAMVALGSAAAAQAATYVGTRVIGELTVSLNLVTDGTIGALSSANIVDFDVTLTHGIFGASSFSRSGGGILLYNFGLSATPTAITFNTDLPNVFLLRTPDYMAFYCIYGTSGACLDGQRNELAFHPVAGLQQLPVASGLVTLATVQSGTIPEPDSWALLIAGFGVVGAAARRRRAALQA